MGRAYGTPVDLGDLETTTVLAQQRLAGDGDEVGVLFRVEAVRYAGCQLTEWGGEDYYVTDPKLEVFAFWVHNWTEYGATLRDEWSGSRRRWVDLRSPGKQWASRTIGQAVEQFADRRRRQIWILKRQLRRARDELRLTGL